MMPLTSRKQIVLEQNLARLRADFANWSADRMARILEHWQGTKEHCDVARPRLHADLHALIGTSASNGYPALSDEAAKLSELLQVVEAGGWPFGTAQERELDKAFDQLAELVQETALFAGSSRPY